MEKELIPYEQALALKELKFDEPCFGYYYSMDNRKVGLEMYIDVRNQDVYYVQAPLYQQCWKWFREKYGLYFNIHRLQHKIGTKQEFMLIINAPLRGGYYETYEQAEFECLFRLIEIVKQKI